MRVNPNRGGDRLQLLVGEHRAAVLRHGVQHLAAQRQERLGLLVAGFLAEPPAESPSTRKSSFLEISPEAQSTSLPGSVAMPLDFLRSTFLPFERRASACSIAS